MNNGKSTKFEILCSPFTVHRSLFTVHCSLYKKMSFEFFISRRYLKSRQKQTFVSLLTLLSIAGVAIGVMALIVVIAVMAGFESDMTERILGVESHIVVMRYGGDFSGYGDTIDRIQKTEGVISATPFVYSQVMLRTSTGLSGAVLRGVDPQSAGKVIRILDPSLLEKLTPDEPTGTPEPNGELPGIILGKELAKTLEVKTGDVLYVILPTGMISPIGHMPAMKRFDVVGTFESGIYDYDGGMVYVHLNQAQDMLRMDDTVTGVEVFIEDIYNARQVADRIEAALGFPYWARDWTQMNQTLFSALKLEKTVMFIILTLIVLVAAFNIAGTLIMVVMEKTKDIAILKAMGATGRHIRRIFVYKGMMIGLIGTVIGEVLGYGLCGLLKRYKFIELPSDIYYISTLPVRIDPLDTVMIAVAALVICYAATLYPAHHASKLNPVEAFRYG
ncbi:MAG: lipoprotein-releasing ABC transporter permease subunit [Desulfobacterales bacterium]